MEKSRSPSPRLRLSPKRYKLVAENFFSEKFSAHWSLLIGINKLKPWESEIEDSLAWLEKENLVLKNEKEYWLSENGKEIFLEAKNKNKGLFEIWKAIQMKVEQLTK